MNSIKAAADFGLTQTMNPVGLTVFMQDIHSLGLNVTQGMYFTTPWHWNQSEEATKWSARFEERVGRKPSYIQAGDYSATSAFLKAVEQTGTDNSDTVMAWLKDNPVNDFFVSNGVIREDGRMMNGMSLLQVKKPEESTGPWDYHKVISTLTADEIYGPLSDSTCSYVKKS